MIPIPPTYPPKIISINKHFLLILSQKTKKHQKSPQNLTPFFYWPLYIFTFQKWKGQFWKKSFFGEMGKWPFQILKMKIFRSEKTNPFFYPITRDIKTNWKSSIYRKVEILYIIGGLWEESMGGETIDQCVYISNRDAPTTLGEKENRWRTPRGIRGRRNFRGWKGQFLSFFYLV